MANNKLSQELGRLYSSMGSANSWKKLVGSMCNWAKDLESKEVRTEAFVTALVNCTRFTPGIVNHGEVMRLLGTHLPELVGVAGETPGRASEGLPGVTVARGADAPEESAGPLHGATSQGEGTHAAGSDKTETR